MSTGFYEQGSILELGYGLSPKRIMQDTRLTIEAKAIYAYLSSFAGNGIFAYPSVEKICNDLRINRKRYYNHVSQLLLCGYLKRHGRKTGNNQFTNNLYEFATHVKLETPETLVVTEL